MKRVAYEDLVAAVNSVEKACGRARLRLRKEIKRLEEQAASLGDSYWVEASIQYETAHNPSGDFRGAVVLSGKHGVLLLFDGSRYRLVEALKDLEAAQLMGVFEQLHHIEEGMELIGDRAPVPLARFPDIPTS